eukprot:6070074-Lingulodinium_polyedra.AAC.1
MDEEQWGAPQQGSSARSGPGHSSVQCDPEHDDSNEQCNMTKHSSERTASDQLCGGACGGLDAGHAAEADSETACEQQHHDHAGGSAS